MSLFRRDWRLEVGGLVVARPLRVSFEVERSTRPTPNAATIRVWNLSRDSQALVEGAGGALVVLEAGYVGERAEIFRGTVLRARAGQRTGSPKSERDGPDVVTTIEATDGGLEYRRARVARGYSAGVSVATVLRDLAGALGVGEGNLREVEALGELDGGARTFPEGTVISGSASGEMTRILRSLGLRWSVQHGALQILQRGAALQTRAVRLSSSTGLVGSPEVGTGGRVTARALLTPELWPGRRVRLEADRIQGQLVARAIRYEGDSHADPWYAVAELVEEAAA